VRAQPGPLEYFGYTAINSGTGLQIWQVHSWDPSELKPIKIWRRGSVGISRDCPIFWGYPYYLRNGKATDVKLCTHINTVNRNKKPMKNFGKNSRGRSPGVSKIFMAPSNPYMARISRSSLR